MRMESYKIVVLIISVFVAMGLLLLLTGMVTFKEDIETIDNGIIVNSNITLNKTEDVQKLQIETHQEIKAEQDRQTGILVRIHNDVQQLLERSNDELNMTSRIIDSKHFE